MHIAGGLSRDTRVVSQVMISVEDLRQALTRVLDKAEQELGRDIDLGADEYWEVPAEATYSLAREPGDGLTVGRLSDDAETVRQMLQADYDIFVWHDLAHLCGVLRRVAVIAQP